MLTEKEKTVAELCAESGISTGTFYRRRKLGMSKEDALIKRLKTKEYLTIGNETKTILEWRRSNHISYQSYYHRIKTGMSKEDAVTIKTESIVGRPKTMIEIDGKIAAVREWCVRYQIHTSTYYNRIRNGMSAKEALQTPVLRGRPKKHREIK